MARMDGAEVNPVDIEPIATYLASLCRELEVKGRAGDVELAALVLDELMIEFERVTVALGKELRREAV